MVKNNQTMKKLFFQRSLKHQDIQGDIRHPVDYLVDLIETKVQSVAFFFFKGKWMKRHVVIMGLKGTNL